MLIIPSNYNPTEQNKNPLWKKKLLKAQHYIKPNDKKFGNFQRYKSNKLLNTSCSLPEWLSANQVFIAYSISWGGDVGWEEK